MVPPDHLPKLPIGTPFDPEKGFSVVDLRGHFSGHGFNASDSSVYGHDAEDTSNWFDNDCIHPNDRGHHEIRRLFHAAIEGLPLEAE